MRFRHGSIRSRQRRSSSRRRMSRQHGFLTCNFNDNIFLAAPARVACFELASSYLRLTYDNHGDASPSRQRIRRIATQLEGYRRSRNKPLPAAKNATAAAVNAWALCRRTKLQRDTHAVTMYAKDRIPLQKHSKQRGWHSAATNHPCSAEI